MKCVRKLPYPYKGALSISSDPDFQNFALFEEFNKFLNTNLLTQFGYGLDLEVTSGIFFYTKNSYNFSYFDEKNNEPSFAPRLREYMKTGWIDTNHAYGDFDHYGGFHREMALCVHDALKTHNIRMPIFTNHGDACNLQNIGKNLVTYNGDKENTQEYHSDLLEKIGCEFVWDQTMVLEKNAISKNIFVDHPLKHKSKLKGFMRLRATKYHAPNLSSFSYQLSLIDFDQLYKHHNIIIIYQHLGVLSRHARHCEIANIDKIISNKFLLSGFYKIAEEALKGNLWVSGTGRLLSYLKMLESISLIEISYNTFDILSSSRVDLSGLTLYTDTRDPVYIYHYGTLVPIVYNGLDETGRYSVTVPFKKLECIWS